MTFPFVLLSVWAEARAPLSTLRLQPVPGYEEVPGQGGLGAVRLRLPVIVPAHQGWQGHQNGFGAPAGLQAEQGAAVVNQVELHVAPPAIELKMPLPLTVLHVFAPLYYGQVGVEKAVPHSAHEIKAALEPALVEIVKKQPAHAPGLTAMPIVKIVIAPLLVAGVDLGAKGFAGLAGNAMPVPTVLFKAVVGGQVVAAAKPPDRLTAGPLRHEEAHISMAGGHVGIAGMDDQGDAHGLKAAAGKLRALRRCRGGRASPLTWENPTPAFSNTPPSLSTRLRTPPISGRCQ